VGFEPTISAGKRPQNYALESEATGIGKRDVSLGINHGVVTLVTRLNRVPKFKNWSHVLHEGKGLMWTVLQIRIIPEPFKAYWLLKVLPG
jgi:hypothetical protein